MRGFLTIVGIVWLISGARDLFLTEKFLHRAKNVLEEDKMAYTKGLGKFECFIGVWFIVYDFLTQYASHILPPQLGMPLFLIGTVGILFYFNQWSRKYTKKSKEAEERANLLPKEKEE